jgi:hypothetical protein
VLRAGYPTLLPHFFSLTFLCGGGGGTFAHCSDQLPSVCSPSMAWQFRGQNMSMYTLTYLHTLTYPHTYLPSELPTRNCSCNISEASSQTFQLSYLSKNYYSSKLPDNAQLPILRTISNLQILNVFLVVAYPIQWIADDYPAILVIFAYLRNSAITMQIVNKVPINGC